MPTFLYKQTEEYRSLYTIIVENHSHKSLNRDIDFLTIFE